MREHAGKTSDRFAYILNCFGYRKIPGLTARGYNP
jgi:hypothetical protein